MRHLSSENTGAERCSYRLTNATQKEFFRVPHAKHQGNVEQPAADIGKDGSKDDSPRHCLGRVLCFFGKATRVVSTRSFAGKEGRPYCPVAPQLVMVQAALRKPNRNEKPGSQPELGSTLVKAYAAVCLSFCMINSVMQTATKTVTWNMEYVLVNRFNHAVERLLMVAWKMTNTAMVPMTWGWVGE